MSGDGKAPNVNEEFWLKQISGLTCGVCWRLGMGDTPCEERHHILDGGRRVGHACTLPTCNFHHQMPGGPKAWERTYGFTELDVLNDTIGRVVAQVRMRGRA